MASYTLTKYTFQLVKLVRQKLFGLKRLPQINAAKFLWVQMTSFNRYALN